MNELEQGIADLKTLDEDNFIGKYKATKRQYRAVTRSLDWLHEAVEALEEAGPMDMDVDLIDDAKCTIIAFTEMLERMHAASYWKGEEQ